MANFSTWSGNFGGIAAGTNGKNTTLSLSSGRVLTSSDQIKSITFTLRITCSRYSSSQTWDLHWFALDSETGSPYAQAMSVAMSDTEHTFSGMMVFEPSDSQKFFYDKLTVYAKANTTHSYTSYMREATITIEYETASLTAPSNLAISQLANGQYLLSWNESIGSNGTGDVTYTVWSISDNEPIENVGTNTYYLANVPGYDYYYEYRVVASYSGVNANSSTIGFYFQPPSITIPTFSLMPELGDSTTLSWTKPTINYGTATYYDYTICYSTSYSSDIEYQTFTNHDGSNISVTIPSSWLASIINDGEIIFFTLTATAHIDSYVANNAYKTRTVTTDAIMFTYDGKRTIGYYNGSEWKECIIYYYNDTEWKECVPYYYDGTNWVELKFN